MKMGLVEFDWNDIEKYSEEDITYFLFIEGKNIDSICKIRNLDRITVQNHIIEGKIKYRFLTRSKNTEELFIEITKAGKRDKQELLSSFDEENKNKLLNFIINSYPKMNSKHKEIAVWILGELKEAKGLGILVKASVNNIVNVRRMAISAMGKLENESCEMPLIRALEDSNPQVITYAIKALQKLNSIKAKEKIILLKDSTDKSYVIKAADEYLSSLEEKL